MTKNATTKHTTTNAGSIRDALNASTSLAGRIIYIIDGGKGGVGKSIVATVVADRYVSCGHAQGLLVVEGDVTNGDVARRFESTGSSTAYSDLRIGDEWLPTFDFIQKSNAPRVVVSTPATADIGDRAPTLSAVANELGYELVTIFVMGKTPDSIELLMDLYTSGAVSASKSFVVVLNEFFGKANTFRRWDESEAKQILTKDPRCKGIIILPELFYSAEDVLLAAPDYSPSQIIASGQLTVATRVELQTWLARLWLEIDKIEKSLLMTSSRESEDV